MNPKLLNLVIKQYEKGQISLEDVLIWQSYSNSKIWLGFSNFGKPNKINTIFFTASTTSYNVELKKVCVINPPKTLNVRNIFYGINYSNVRNSSYNRNYSNAINNSYNIIFLIILMLEIIHIISINLHVSVATKNVIPLVLAT